jgi:hypothetical protein
LRDGRGRRLLHGEGAAEEADDLRVDRSDRQREVPSDRSGDVAHAQAFVADGVQSGAGRGAVEG